MQCGAAPDNFTVLHYEADALKFRDIKQRIAGDGNEVGKFAYLDGARPFTRQRKSRRGRISPYVLFLLQLT
jgi:hypothetical protein